MELSVVIPTYNQAGLLRECLRTLLDQTLPPQTYELIVVDDGSTDQTPAVLQEVAQAHPQVRPLRLPANRGRSAARNAGIARAAAPVILFTDSDVVVRKDFLAQHLRAHREYGPGILSRGPVILIPEAAAAARARIPRFAASPAYLDTANAAIEKSLLVAAGLFDEGFPGYGWEDFELGARLKALGVRRIFCRQAAAFHVQMPVDADRVEPLLRKEEERARSAVYFFQRHQTFATRWLIQATAWHRAVYWVQTGAGRLTPGNIVDVSARLRRAGLPGVAYLALRGVLNRHYLHALDTELRRHARAAA